jgi:hypothetical protein
LLLGISFVAVKKPLGLISAALGRLKIVEMMRENPGPAPGQNQPEGPADKNSGRRRPNAKYPLSEKKPGDEELVFYYSRERRLSAASPPVKALYVETPKKRFGFFRSLTATRPLAMLFTSILFLCAAIVIISIVNPAGTAYTLGGNRITVEAVEFGGETMVALTKTVTDTENAYTGLVDIGAAPALSGENAGEDYPVFTHRIFFSLNAKEEYRFSLPFEAAKLLILLQGEQDTVRFTIKVKRH